MTPLILQRDARRWVRELGPGATLDDVPEGALDDLAEQGVRWLYLVGVWPTGPRSRDLSRADAGLRSAYRRALPDVTDGDVCGSAFAVARYEAAPALGGDPALARLRERLHRRRLRLMVDVVPNHTGLDHPWARRHPERYVRGAAVDLDHDPDSWVRIGDDVLAHGRDPHFPAWRDTLQLDLSGEAGRRAIEELLQAAAARADGLRVDMAMLLLPEVFERTWGRPAAPFWPDALARLRRSRPELCLVAEVYWDLGDRLLGDGFDLVYDKDWYDAVRDGDTGTLARIHRHDAERQQQDLRFLENHDEPRAASVLGDRLAAALVATFLSPAAVLLHEGQIAGRRIQPSVHLSRTAEEPPDPAVRDLHRAVLGLRHRLAPGTWRPLAGAGAEGLIGHHWQLADARAVVALSNLGERSGEAELPAPPADVLFQRGQVTGAGRRLTIAGSATVVVEL